MRPHVKRAYNELLELGFKDVTTPRSRNSGTWMLSHPQCPDDDPLFLADKFNARRCGQVLDEGRRMLGLLTRRELDRLEISRLMCRPPGF